jgi:hypothetical protein
MEIVFKYWIALHYVNPDPPPRLRPSTRPSLSVLRGGKSLTYRFHRVDRKEGDMVELDCDDNNE